jgi:hypothetical protein
MRYEVWCGDVKVYESDLEVDLRAIVDGVQVYSLLGIPTFEEGPEGFTRIPTGGKATGNYVDDKGKEHKVLDKGWKP